MAAEGDAAAGSSGAGGGTFSAAERTLIDSERRLIEEQRQTEILAAYAESAAARASIHIACGNPLTSSVLRASASSGAGTDTAAATPVGAAVPIPAAAGSASGLCAYPVLSPAALSAEHAYLRPVAMQLLASLLPAAECGSPAQALLYREILTTCVIQPALHSADFDVVNGLLLFYLGPDYTGPETGNAGAQAGAQSNSTGGSGKASPSLTDGVAVTAAANPASSAASAASAGSTVASAAAVPPPPRQPLYPPHLFDLDVASDGPQTKQRTQPASITSSSDAPGRTRLPSAAPALPLQPLPSGGQHRIPSVVAADFDLPRPRHNPAATAPTGASPAASWSHAVDDLFADTGFRFFCGCLSRTEAEAVLQGCPVGTFLLRAVEGGTLVLSYVRSKAAADGAAASGSRGSESDRSPAARIALEGLGVLDFADVEVAHTVVRLVDNLFSALNRGPFPRLASLLRGLRDVVYYGVIVEDQCKPDVLSPVTNRESRGSNADLPAFALEVLYVDPRNYGAAAASAVTDELLRQSGLLMKTLPEGIILPGAPPVADKRRKQSVFGRIFGKPLSRKKDDSASGTAPPSPSLSSVANEARSNFVTPVLTAAAGADMVSSFALEASSVNDSLESSFGAQYRPSQKRDRGTSQDFRKSAIFSTVSPLVKQAFAIQQRMSMRMPMNIPTVLSQQEQTASRQISGERTPAANFMFRDVDATAYEDQDLDSVEEEAFEKAWRETENDKTPFGESDFPQQECSEGAAQVFKTIKQPDETPVQGDPFAAFRNALDESDSMFTVAKSADNEGGIGNESDPSTSRPRLAMALLPHITVPQVQATPPTGLSRNPRGFGPRRVLTKGATGARHFGTAQTLLRPSERTGDYCVSEEDNEESESPNMISPRLEVIDALENTNELISAFIVDYRLLYKSDSDSSASAKPAHDKQVTKATAVYLVRITIRGYSWIISRRFSELKILNDFAKHHTNSFMAQFPSRQILVLSQNDKTFLENRRAALNDWLQGALANTGVANAKPFRIFFAPEPDTEIQEDGDLSTGARWCSENGNAPVDAEPLTERSTSSNREGEQSPTRDFQSSAPSEPFKPPSSKSDIMHSLTNAEIARVEARVFALLTEIFDLRSSNWLRRQLFGVVRTFARLSYNDSTARRLSAAFSEVISPSSIANQIKYFREEVFWPSGGVFRTQISPKPADVLWRTREQSRDVLLASMPSALASILGKDSAQDGCLVLFEFIQIPILLKSLVYTIFDLLLARLFPDMNVYSQRA
jgi:hypothetical protein